ncbi:hypothetical protein ACFQY0_09735 [Haloferula chungangensis]|uniref:Uncharacterized protein n=1 Tax=Haloferula chungangensis TaxID=1048331 RepID=A0ABW2L8F0_9BACT
MRPPVILIHRGILENPRFSGPTPFTGHRPLSLVTAKPIPKDVDVLVEVDDGMPLGKLARLTRQLLGKTLQSGDGCAADVFISSPKGEYLGRICSYKNCAPDIQTSCQAKHCGRRTHLCDDLQNVHLDPSLVAAPPLSLVPDIVAHTGIPDDVREILVAGLR